MIRYTYIKITLMLLFTVLSVRADVLHIEPYAQWTFDAPMEQVIFREGGQGFSIKYTITKDIVAHYDSLGNRLREVKRSPEDIFQINQNESGFMLVQEHSSNQADNPQRLYSFQLYNANGTAAYTYVHSVQLGGGILDYKLTNYMSLMLIEQGQDWILEIDNEDTLLYIESCLPDQRTHKKINVIAEKLRSRNETVSAASCKAEANEDSLMLELRLWNHNMPLGDPVMVPGKLEGVKALTGTNYFFLEIFDGFESTLTLFNRDVMLGKYPWKTWNISPLGSEGAFVISESDLNVINLGDGSVSSSYHPIDLSTISDATFLYDWGLFLYIRYEPFFTESGQQAYRKFELEGVNKTGRIAHRSSFGSWTTSLPKLSRISKDLFAIHIHNAVLLYRVELERN